MYNKIIKEQLNEGFIKKCNVISSVDYVIPHRTVFRKHSFKYKTRIGHNAPKDQIPNYR